EESPAAGGHYRAHKQGSHIAEGFELLLHLGIEVRGLAGLKRFLAGTLRGPELRPEIARAHRPLAGEVVELLGVGPAVVEEDSGDGEPLLDEPPLGGGHRRRAQAQLLQPGESRGVWWFRAGRTVEDVGDET